MHNVAASLTKTKTLKIENKQQQRDYHIMYACNNKIIDWKSQAFYSVQKKQRTRWQNKHDQTECSISFPHSSTSRKGRVFSQTMEQQLQTVLAKAKIQDAMMTFRLLPSHAYTGTKIGEREIFTDIYLMYEHIAALCCSFTRNATDFAGILPLRRAAFCWRSFYHSFASWSIDSFWLIFVSINIKRLSTTSAVKPVIKS